MTLVALYVLVNVLTTIFIILASGDGVNYSFVNPKVIYDNLKVNWFGAILLTTIANVLLPAVAIPYWIYKLCTVGRK